MKKLATVSVTGPAGTINVNAKDLDRYRDRGYRLTDEVEAEAAPAPDPAPDPVPVFDFSTLTVDRLKEFAADYDIDLDGASNKAAIVEAISTDEDVAEAVEAAGSNARIEDVENFLNG